MANPVFKPASNPFDPGDDFPSTAVGVTLPDGVAGVEPDYEYEVSAVFKNLVVESWSGKEKRSEQAPVRRRWKISFLQLTPTDANTLWSHYLAQKGDLHSFAYFDYLSGEEFTARYANGTMSRSTFLYEAEKSGIELVEVL